MSIAPKTRLALLEVLKYAPPQTLVPIKDYLKARHFNTYTTNPAYLVILKGGTKAIFKPSPKGSSLAAAEVAAYKASLALGFPKIPITSVREIKQVKKHHTFQETGSIQAYIEPSIDSLKPTAFKKALKEADPEEIANISLFNFVMGKWDCIPANLIVHYNNTAKPIFYSIDNASIRHRQFTHFGSIPFVFIDNLKRHQYNQSSNETFPWNSTRKLAIPTTNNLKAIFGLTITPKILKDFTLNTKPKYFVVYQNAVWRQYHRDEDVLLFNHTNIFPQKSIESLKKLNLKTLRNIFSHALNKEYKNSYFTSNNHFKDILQRRDQVIDVAEQIV